LNNLNKDGDMAGQVFWRV